MVSKCLGSCTTVSPEKISSETSCHWCFIFRWIQQSSESTNFMILHGSRRAHYESFTMPFKTLVKGIVQFGTTWTFAFKILWKLNISHWFRFISVWPGSWVQLLFFCFRPFQYSFYSIYQKQKIYKIGILNGGQVLTFLEQNTLKTSVMCYVNPVDYWSILNRENDLTARFN